jgi:hypothetical protein
MSEPRYLCPDELVRVGLVGKLITIQEQSRRIRGHVYDWRIYDRSDAACSILFDIREAQSIAATNYKVDYKKADWDSVPKASCSVRFNGDDPGICFDSGKGTILIDAHLPDGSQRSVEIYGIDNLDGLTRVTNEAPRE